MSTPSAPPTDPSILEPLSTRHEERVAVLLESYLIALEDGAPPTVAELAKDDPELAPVLGEYIQSLQALHTVSNMPPAGAPDAAESNATETSGSPNRDGSDRRMGDFRLIEVIGRGGMGTVYRAEQISLHRIVAVKVLPLAAALDDRQITRFCNEAATMASLDHPHIVPVYAVGCENNIHFYAMRLIEGPSIDEVIRQQQDESTTTSNSESTGKNQLNDWRHAVQLAIDAADALHAAHEMGVVHRDIKPSNLMIDEKGRLCITDFGLAHCQMEEGLTRSGDVVGTAKYMSPEQAQGESAMVDGRSDVYSLAVTLYEMISLQAVHEGTEQVALSRLLNGNAPTPLRQLRPSLPRDLDVVVAKAMAMSRDDRYETAHAFANDLRCVLAGQPTAAKPPTAFDRILAWAVAHRRSAATLMLIGAAALVTFAFSSARIAAAKHQSDEAATRARRNELLARGAIDNLGSKMAELLSDIPSAEPVRRELLRQTLDYYQQLATDTQPGDSTIHRDLAIHYGKIGALQRDLGLARDAVESLRQSESLYSQLVAANAREARDGDNDLAMEWATSQNNLADALRQASQAREASDWFAKSIAEYRRLLQKTDQTSSSHAEIERRLAASLNNLGLLLASLGDRENAETAYMQSIQILQQQNSNSPSPQASGQLAAVRSNISALLAKSQPDRAAEYARQALATQLQQSSGNHEDAKIASQAMATLCSLGESFAAKQQHQQAAESFERSAKIGEQLLQRWPEKPTYRRDLVVSLNHLGLSQSALGQLEQARYTFERVVDYQTDLSAERPDNAELHNMLAGALNNLGFIHEQLKNVPTAKRCYQQAVQHQQNALKLAPAATQFRHDLKTHQENLRNLERSS